MNAKSFKTAIAKLKLEVLLAELTTERKIDLQEEVRLLQVCKVSEICGQGDGSP